MSWHRVAALADLAARPALGVRVGDVTVALFRIGDEVFATSNVCTHRFAFLSDGRVADGCVECPLHQGRFDVRSGRAVDGPVDVDLRTFPVRVVDGEILVEIEAPAPAPPPAEPERAAAPAPAPATAPPRVAAAAGGPALVVIGAGQAGARVAESAREAGFAGRVVLAGAEAHWPYERPPLSKEHLTGARRPGPRTVLDAGRAAALGIEAWHARRALALDPEHRTVAFDDGSELAYDALVLATGARPRRLRVPGDDLDGILYLRDLEDADALRARLADASRIAIVGGGLIGMEVASSAAATGVRAVVIEQAPRLLARALPRAAAAHVQRAAEGAGVRFVLGDAVAAFEGRGTVAAVALEGEDAIEVDAVLVAIGVEPADALARAAGLAVDDGIVVDAFGRTSADGIFAVGDVACFESRFWRGRRRPESWHVAERFGRALGRTLAGTPTAFDEVPWYWTDQFGLAVQMLGNPADGPDVEVVRDAGAGALAWRLGDGERETGVVAIDAPDEIRRGRARLAAPARG